MNCGTQLGKQARQWTARESRGQFRMSIDRAFYLQGRGLILTGTIASGTVMDGDTLLLQPQHRQVRVRGIHTQDAPSSSGNAGERCALNVSSEIRREDIERGDWLTGEGCIGSGSRFDTHIHLLADAAFPLKHLSEVKLHIGAKRTTARLILLHRESGTRIQPGESAYAQFVTERPIHCCHGDRFLLRDYGETATLGGGKVLDPEGAERHKSSADRLAFLAAMQHDNIENAIRALLVEHGGVLDYDTLVRARNTNPGERPGEHLAGIARIRTNDCELWLTQSQWSGLQQELLQTLQQFHRDQPGEAGMEPAQLTAVVSPVTDERLIEPAIAELTRSGEVRLTNNLLAAEGFQSQPSEQQDGNWLVIASCLRKHGRQIPNLAQLEQECGLDKRNLQTALDRARRDRRAVRLNAKRYVETPLLYEFAQAVLTLTRDKPSLTVAEFRDQLGCGRNVLIEVLEYFDSIGFTRRVGNARIVLDREVPEKQLAA